MSGRIIRRPWVTAWYHVNLSNGMWAVRRHGAIRSSKRMASKKEAVSMAKRLAKRVFVHKKNGSVDYVL